MGYDQFITTLDEEEKEIGMRFKALINNKRIQAAYQFLLLEAIIRKVKDSPDEIRVDMNVLFIEFTQIAYDLCYRHSIELGGKGQSRVNMIIDEFISIHGEKPTLSEEDIIKIKDRIVSTSVKKWVIENITKSSVGLFKEEKLLDQEFISMSPKVKAFIIAYTNSIHEENEKALYEYLIKIEQNRSIAEKVMGRNNSIEVKKSEQKIALVYDYKEEELITHIHHYIKQKGFTYSVQTIANLYLSLKTKPFTILSGISGTGKSKIVQLFAEALGATMENGRYQLIAVRPDWSDSTDLLGYRDLNNHFNPGMMTQVIEDAMEHPEVPYFVCLDEMNLARVEYYFSDFLAVIESRKWAEDQIVTYPIIQSSILGSDKEAVSRYRTLYLPDNLYIIGTVNMDETTYPFSKKVLDRANTIEFSEVNLWDDFLEVPSQHGEVLNVSNSFLKSDYLTLRECIAYKEVAQSVITDLIALNTLLEPAQMHFAYRVRDEIVFYMVYNERFGLMTREAALDLQLMQKVLPRISGNTTKVIEVLEAVLTYIETHIGEMKAYEKVQFMIERYRQDGFTSYWM